MPEIFSLLNARRLKVFGDGGRFMLRLFLDFQVRTVFNDLRGFFPTSREGVRS